MQRGGIRFVPWKNVFRGIAERLEPFGGAAAAADAAAFEIGEGAGRGEAGGERIVDAGVRFEFALNYGVGFADRPVLHGNSERDGMDEMVLFGAGDSCFGTEGGEAFPIFGFACGVGFECFGEDTVFAAVRGGRRFAGGGFGAALFFAVSAGGED